MNVRTIFALVVVAASYPGTVLAGPKPESLVSAWYIADEFCRGESDEKIWEPSCGFRDVVLGAELNKLGMCYGKKNQPSSDAKWHKCGPDSERN
jgi:hypothetical protein